MSLASLGKTEPEKPKRKGPKPLSRVLKFLTNPPTHDTDKRLDTLRCDIGIKAVDTEESTSTTHTPSADDLQAATAIHVLPTESIARPILYAPDMDGRADPGEVVWIWVPSDGLNQPPKERSMVVVGRNHSAILGLLISCNTEHKEQESWLEMGAGAWDPRGRQSWVRIDRVLEVPALGIRRSGTVIPRHRFDRVANRLRTDFNWN